MIDRDAQMVVYLDNLYQSPDYVPWETVDEWEENEYEDEWDDEG